MALGKLTEEQKKQHEEMYYPVAKVHGPEGTGSGVVIFSQEHGGKVYTYVLTNHHVIDDAISIEEKWDPSLKKQRRQEEIQPCAVQFFQYNNYSKAVGSSNFEADIVAYNHKDQSDIALLKLRDTEKLIEHVAKLYPYEHRGDIFMFDKVYAVGAALGVPVFQTPGEVTNAYYEIGGQGFLGTNAAISFGSSGGGLFKEDEGHYYLIGLPARVSMETWSSVANHIGFAVPVGKIYEMLKENCYEHIWDDEHNPEDDKERRQEKIKKAKKQRETT